MYLYLYIYIHILMFQKNYTNYKFSHNDNNNVRGRFCFMTPSLPWGPKASKQPIWNGKLVNIKRGIKEIREPERKKIEVV